MDKKELSSYIDIVSNVVTLATLFLLPVLFLTNLTDAFILPKQFLIIFATSIILILWGIKAIIERKIVVTSAPVNLPLVIFGIVVVVSSILSVNRYDSLFQTIPVVFAILFSLTLINNIKTKSSFNFALYAYVLGASVSAVITLLYYMKIYFFPIPAIQNQLFNTAGSSVQQLIYLLPVLIFSVLYLGRRFNFANLRGAGDSFSKGDYGVFVQAVAVIASVVGILVIAAQIVFLPNKPILLPYAYGLQTAFAAISQDATRFLYALLFGSGYGTFLADFTKYKLPSFNLEQNIWNLSFSFSSSYFLELIATSGVLGALSFLSIVFSVIKTRATKKPLFVALFVAFVLAILLPFSFITVTSLFILVGLYFVEMNVENDKRVYDVTLSLVTTKSGMLAFEATPEGERPSAKAESPIFPIIVMVAILLAVGFVGYYTFKFLMSDVTFAKSLQAAQANNGQQTYQLQTQAINEFPYRADYHRIFSQVNLALANSLAAGVPQGKTPSQQVQQNIIALLQQSINSGRNAVVLSPLNSVNWENLGQIYRNLINVGQNADQFSVASINQAIALDPYNPQLYIELGGVYYQLQQWDQAQQQFQVAINLKRDFANAYYNLGHVFEQKGDLQNALAAYNIVKQLSVNNQDNLNRINAEIKTIEDKLGSQKQATGNVTPETQQTPLALPSPSANLPEQKPPIKISPPPAETPAPSSAPSPTPAK